MFFALLYKLKITLLNDRFDTLSMMARPLINAILYVVFSLFYIDVAGNVSYMLASLAIFNVFTNTIQGTIYLGAADTIGKRLDNIFLAGSSFGAFITSEALLQLIVALVQSLLIYIFAYLCVPSFTVALLVGSLFGLGLFAVVSLLVAAIFFIIAIRTKRVAYLSCASVVIATFSGSFFPVQTLPALFRSVALANPLTYALDFVRSTLLGSAYLIDPLFEVAITLATIALLTLILIGLSSSTRASDRIYSAR